MTGRRLQRTTLAVLVATLSGMAPALAGGPLVCIAPTDPADAGRPLQDILALEFYADEANPALSYSVPFVRLSLSAEADGRTVSGYSVKNSTGVEATIVFAGPTPLSFAVTELGRTYDSLKRNDEETTFLADAVPGVVCYSVSVERLPL